MARIETWYKQDLKRPVKVQTLMGNVFTLDNVGSLIGVEVFSDGVEETLTGAATGYCILPDGTTISVPGTRSGNKAYILLPQSVLAYPGLLKITVKLTNGNEITTLLAVIATVARSRTDAIITPSQQIITDWSQQIAAEMQAVEDASAAQDAKINDLKSAISVQAESNTGIDFVWTAGYITNAGATHAQTGLSQYYSQLLHGSEFSEIKMTVGDGMQFCVANYNKDNGNFVSRGEWQTADAPIDNQYDVIINIALTTAKTEILSANDISNKFGIKIVPPIEIKQPEYVFDFGWEPGYINTSGKVDSRQAFNNFYSKLLHNFGEIIVKPNNLRQFNVAYFNKYTGAFVSRSAYITTETVINDAYDIIISIATTVAASTGGTVTKDNVVAGFMFYVDNVTKPKWNGTKAAFVGDSITYGVNTDSDNIYYKIINNFVGYADVYADGVAGSCYSVMSNYGSTITPITQRYQNIPTDTDLIVIFAGTNDWGHNTPLGTISDTTDISFYGALHVVISGILAANPSGRLVLCTPLHRWGFGDYAEDTGSNGQGLPLKAYVDAIKESAAMFGVPVIDLFSLACLNPRIPEIKTAYVTDGLHPNAAGHNILARRLMPMLELQ